MFKEVFTESKATAEITTASQKELVKVWPNVTYKGEEWFNGTYMKFLDYFNQNTRELEDTQWDEEVCEEEQDEDGEWYDDCWMETVERRKQESYTGYIPSKDIFITGYDMWEGDDDLAGIVYWSYDGRRFKIISENMDYGSNMMYGRNGAHKKLKKKHSDLVDLRLD